MTNIIMCPSHLINKWKNEIERLVPNSKAYIIKTISDLIALDTKIKSKIKNEHTYLIISKESAKISYEMRPATIWSKSKNTFICPCCGEKLYKKIKVKYGRETRTEKIEFSPFDMMKQMAYNSYCENCKSTLWTPFNKEEVNPKWIKLGSIGWIMFEHVDYIYDLLSAKITLDKKESELFIKITDLKEAINNKEEFKGIKAPRRYSIAKYIRERYKNYIDYFICDELKCMAPYTVMYM